MNEKRSLHGQYDHEKHLPDNSLQPSGSGTNVWLLKQILAIHPTEGQLLIEVAKEHGPKRYTWLAAHMHEIGYVSLAKEYHLRKKQDAAIRVYKEHQHRIEQWKERLVNEEASGEVHLASVRKKMAKDQKYLDEHQHIKVLIEARQKEANS